MIQAAAENRVNECIEMLRPMLHTMIVNEFALKRVERTVDRLWEAKTLKPGEYHMLVAMMASARNNRDQAEAHAWNAFELGKGDAVVVANCLVIFGSFASTERMLPLIHHITDRFPDDKQMLSYAILYARVTMHFNLAREIHKKRALLTVNDAVVANGEKTHTELMLERAESYSLNDSELCARLDTAVSAVRAEGINVRRTSTLALDDGTFIFRLHVPVDDATCASLNFAIADALVESYDNTAIDFFSIVCAPLSDLRAIKGHEVLA